MPTEDEVVEFLAKRWFDSTPGKKPGDGGRPTWSSQPKQVKEVFLAKARHFLSSPYDLQRSLDEARTWARQAQQILSYIRER